MFYHRGSFEETSSTAQLAPGATRTEHQQHSPLMGLLLLASLIGFLAFVASLYAGLGILLGLAIYSVAGLISFLGAVTIRLAMARPAPLAAGRRVEAGAQHAAWHIAARRNARKNAGRNTVPGGLPDEWTRDSVARPTPLRAHVPTPAQRCIDTARGRRRIRRLPVTLRP